MMSVETSTSVIRSPSYPSSKDRVFRDGPRSLIISPNLDALLEHEERVNRGARSAPCTGLSSSPIAVSPTGSEGLPPPPRGPRKTRPRCAGAEDISLALSPVEAGWPASNPYINPAPSLDEVLGNNHESRRSSMSVHDSTTRIENEHDKENGAGGRTAETAVVTQGPGDGRTPVSDNKNGHPCQQSQSKYVEKLFSLSKTAFRLRFDGTIQKNQNIQPPSPTHIRERARLRGKLIKPKDLRKSICPVMEELPVFDIRRLGGGLGNPLSPSYEGPYRPLHSHGSSPRSPTASYRSSSLDSTRSPPTATFRDPRISISSTIYPGSSNSHSHTLYDTAESPPFLFLNKPLARHHTSPSVSERHSFIEILSPSSPEFSSTNLTQRSAGDMNLENFWSGRARFSSAPSSRDRSSSPKPRKPPIPTSPKPTFNRSKRTSPEPTPIPSHHSDLAGHRGDLPPTTNFLDMDERADLVRKSRKLAQVFGQPPGAESLSQQDNSTSACLAVPNLKQKHHRGALSMHNDTETSILRQQMPSFQSHAQHLYEPIPGGRRHSLPLSPDEMTFLGEITGDDTNTSKLVDSGVSIQKLASDSSALRAQIYPRSVSPTSFIDLSDEEVVGDGTPATMNSKRANKRRLASPSRQSLYENMSPEDQVEEERRRKREKLAKLHRFLGSRVPTNLVLGFDIPLALPDVSEIPMNTQEGNGEARKVWLRRRRSSSAAAVPSTWSDEVDRLKEDLNDREKAINVRRAQKMEKVFGVAPPQTLYHTRHSPSPSVPTAIIGPPRLSSKHASVRELPARLSSSPNNPNVSAHAKSRTKRSDRPGTSDSNAPLIPKDENNDNLPTVRRNSLVYTHYQHSLKSLSDILDRDDKESLAELHQYLNTVEVPVSPPIQELSRVAERRSSVTSLKSERRRSLPARTSLISIASEYSMVIATPKPDVTDFQLRRRRAAKLTQFFGVDYRDLINDVLESIENGLEHERKRGTLRADEVEDLLLRLRNLRIKRGGN